MDGLKQRIIGALVLVCLAVIFVPMIFDEPHTERTSTSIRIPEEPPFPEVETPDSDFPETPAYRIEEPVSDMEPDARNTESSGSEAPQPTAETADSSVAPVTEPADESGSTANQTPAPDTETSLSGSDSDSTDDTGSAEFTRSLEGAWVVQLGSFGNADNARRLRDSVRDMGYSAHLQEVVRGDATLTRVFSGPFAAKTDAEQAKKALDSKFEVNSLVTSGGK